MGVCSNTLHFFSGQAEVWSPKEGKNTRLWAGSVYVEAAGLCTPSTLQGFQALWCLQRPVCITGGDKFVTQKNTHPVMKNSLEFQTGMLPTSNKRALKA